MKPLPGSNYLPTKLSATPTTRANCGIQATEDEIVAKPYLLCEQDQGDADSEPIALESIDRGMRSEGDAAVFIPKDEIVAQDDDRRIRAVAAAVLAEAAQAGDTLLPFQEAQLRIAKHFPENRICQPDRDLMIAEANFYRKLLHFDYEGDPS